MKKAFVIALFLLAAPVSAQADKPTYATALCKHGSVMTACPPGVQSNLGAARPPQRSSAAFVPRSNPGASGVAGAVNLNGSSGSVAFSQVTADSVAAGQKSHISVAGQNNTTNSVTGNYLSTSVAERRDASVSSVAFRRDSSNSVTGAVFSSSSTSSGSSSSVASGQGGSASVVR